MRARLGATLAVLGALGAVAVGTHAADAATPDTFTVISAGATSGSPDQVTVVVDSPTSSTISNLSAGFVTGGSDAYDVTLTAGASEVDPNDSTQTQTTYTSGNIPWGTSSTTGLPLGSYSITLTGTFSDSPTPYQVADAGTYNFQATSAVTLSATPTSLTYGATSTALSGRVTLTNPDGTQDPDFSSLTSVTIESGGSTVETLPLSSTGSFSDPSFAPSVPETIDAALAGTATVAGSVSPTVTLDVFNTGPNVSLKANSVTVTYGKTATVTGTLTYGTSATPVVGQEVFVSTNQTVAGALATATTNSTGGFTITLPVRAAGGSFWVGSVSGKDLSASTPVALTLKVVHPTAISGFKTTLNQYWALSVSGCLGFPAADKSEKITHTTGLTVEYASPGGAWKKLGVINGNEADRACGTGGIEFTGTYTAPENYAYYRVVYAGTTGATSFAAATGNSVLAWRYADRIVDLKVSPTVVNAGGKLAISGVLQYYYSGWHNYSGQTIVIYLHPKGSNPTWYWLVKIKTNSKGQFSTSFKDPVSATWQAVFEGNNSNGVGHLSTGSSEVYVRLK